MTYTISLERNPTSEDIQILNDGISHEAQKKKQLTHGPFFAFFIRDENGKIVGGCNGDILYGQLYVSSLWVDEKLRGQGYGTKLMQLAEAHAKENNCSFISVNTMSFEAPEFYKKLGFTVEFERHGFDKDSIFYFFRKDLCIQQNNNKTGDLIPNTHYRLYKNSENAAEIIDAQLFAFNKKCVPPIQSPEIINIRYIIKENDVFIGGISACAYIWKIMQIDLLFVEELHRHNDLGTILLKKVEDDAKKLGVSLIHLDTFDFQAKDFYLKHGYEIFGVLDDCPKTHKRYYLKKNILNQYFKSDDVVNFYSQLDSLGIKIWLDGGFGVDALLERQTRLHSDLDIIVQKHDVMKLHEFLISHEYKDIKRDDTSEWNFVLGDSKGHEIDVHVITFDDKGNGIYGPVKKGVFYPEKSLLGEGCIEGVTVRCLTPEYQIESHTGYQPSEKDFKDVNALCEKFGIECPLELKIAN